MATSPGRTARTVASPGHKPRDAHFADDWRSVGLDYQASEANYAWHSANLEQLYQKAPANQLSSPPRSYRETPPWKKAKELRRAAKAAQQAPGSRGGATSKPGWDPSPVVSRGAEPSRRENSRPLSASRSMRASASSKSLRHSQSRGAPQQQQQQQQQEEQDGGGGALASSYALSEGQAQVYDKFAQLLSQFDTAAMLDILEDVLHDAQDRTLLADYFGSED